MSMDIGGRLAEKPQAAPAPAAPPPVKDAHPPLNTCVAVKPVRNKPRDLKSRLITLDYGTFMYLGGWGGLRTVV